jgi:hypothetical protein
LVLSPGEIPALPVRGGQGQGESPPTMLMPFRRKICLRERSRKAHVPSNIPRREPIAITRKRRAVGSSLETSIPSPVSPAANPSI